MILRGILAFIAAVLVTDVTLAWVNTTFVIAELQALGIEVPFGKRVSTMMQDVVGIAPNILPALVIGFAVAFAVAWAVVRWVLPGRGAVGYPLAGLTCLLVVDLALGQIFSTHPARSAVGCSSCWSAAGATMGRFNDPRRDENAEALRRRLKAARTGERETPLRGRPLLVMLLAVGLLGGLLVLLGLL